MPDTSRSAKSKTGRETARRDLEAGEATAA
jgi:hypothetical protein